MACPYIKTFTRASKKHAFSPTAPTLPKWWLPEESRYAARLKAADEVMRQRGSQVLNNENGEAWTTQDWIEFVADPEQRSKSCDVLRCETCRSMGFDHLVGVTPDGEVWKVNPMSKNDRHARERGDITMSAPPP